MPLLAPPLAGQAPEAEKKAEKSTEKKQPEPAAAGTLTLEKVEARIKEIEALPDLGEDVKKKALELFGQAAANLKKAAEHAALAESYRKSIEEAPAAAAAIRARLEKPAPNPEEIDAGIAPDAPQADLDVALTKQKAAVAAARAELEKKEAELQAQQGRVEKAREEQAAARKALAEIEKSLKAAATGAGANPIVAEASRAVLESGRVARTEEIGMLEQEALSHPMRVDLLQAQRDEAARKVATLEARLQKIQELVNQRRAVEAERAKAEAEKAKQEAIGKHEAIKKVAEENSQLTEELARIAAEDQAIAADKKLKDAQKTQLTEEFARTKSQLEEVGLSGVGGALMRQQRKRLPVLLADNRAVAARWSGKIPAGEARRFEIGMMLRDLADLDAATAKIVAAEVEPSVPEAERQEIAAEIRALLEKRRELLEKLSTSYDSHIKALRELETVQSEIARTAAEYTQLLEEWLLWIPSATIPDRKTAAALLDSLSWIASPKNWIALGETFLHDLRRRPVIHGLAYLAFLLLLVGRRRLRREMVQSVAHVGRVHTDSFLLTFKAFALSFVIPAPIPLLAAFLGWRLAAATGAEGAATFASAVGNGLLALAAILYPLRLVAVICARDGLAEAHFRWSASTLALVRRQLRWFIVVVAVTAFIVALAEGQPDESIQGSLGRLAFIVGAIAEAILIQRLVRPTGAIASAILQRKPSGWLSKLRWIWYPLAVGLPVGLAVIAVLGYFYTALDLERRVLATAGLLVGAAVLRALALRWLVVEERRMAVEKARRKREEERQRAAAAPGAPEGGGETEQAEIEIPEIDISTINDQTRRLLGAIVALAVFFGLWSIWASVLPALGILNEVELWSTTVTAAGGAQVVQWITLKHALLCAIAFALTWIAAKNLPGVLEIAVLKNLPLDPGVRFALTTVSQYILAVVGVVIAFNIIGVGWSKVQWLAAAMSVGIGFGLQEIIANFFCGLILLFERPIRVGDIVTVGDVMGTVTRIRIRATTITNWDKMEYIVPNKDLITGRLLNWTLTNTINRIVIKVGVAYGSDTGRARELLLEAAREHPLIMDDPGPVASFEGFGDSTLDLLLRCYLPDFANRLGVITELHTAIDRKFAEAGLEIAFPQLDIHVKSGEAPRPPEEGPRA